MIQPKARIMTINGTIDVEQKKMVPLMHIALRHALTEQTTQLKSQSLL